MAEHIPEDMMVKILQRLPIKSLIRFTCVSKRWRFIILSDHQFAKSQFQTTSEQTRTRLLLSTASQSEYESLDMESFSVTKLSCPFKQPDDVVRILSSCNGLVCATSLDRDSRYFPSNLYIWNPSTGFFKKLPESLNVQRLRYFGFGHLSATDDYKVIAKIEKKQQAEIFSSRANTWKTIQVPSDVEPFGEGFLFNEALHWISIKNFPNYSIDVVAFDLAKEEFRKIPLPATLKNAAALSSFRGCLCVFDYAYNTAGSIYLWVMREYNMTDAWTKLFNIKIPIPPENAVHILRPILVTETSTFLRLDMMINAAIESKLLRSVHHQEEKLETYMVSSGGLRIRDMIIFKESLLWLY